MASSDFSKNPKLSIKGHGFIIGFFIGVTYLLAISYPELLNIILFSAIATYALFWVWLECRDTKGKAYQNGIAHFPTHVKDGK